MRKSKRLLALFLGLVMCCSLLAGCGSKNETADKPAADNAETAEAGTLVLSATGFENKFSPFFAASADDQDVADFTQLYMMYADRVSNPILNGIEGETRSYNGTDYTYTGPRISL